MQHINDLNTDQKTDSLTKRGRGRPPKIKEPLTSTKDNNQPIIANNKKENENKRHENKRHEIRNETEKRNERENGENEESGNKLEDNYEDNGGDVVSINMIDHESVMNNIDFFNDTPIEKHPMYDLIESQSHRELESLDQVFNNLMVQVTGFVDNPLMDKKQLHNHLLQYYHKLEQMMLNTLDVPDNNTQLNRHYDVKNEINLINIHNDPANTDINITDILSEPEFISHISKKDTFLNKYNVIIYENYDPIPSHTRKTS